MANVINLVKASWNVKKEIQRCLDRPKDSKEYILAEQYRNYLNGMEDKDLSSAQIESLEKKVEGEQNANRDNQHALELLSSVSGFLGALRNMNN